MIFFFLTCIRLFCERSYCTASLYNLSFYSCTWSLFRPFYLFFMWHLNHLLILGSIPYVAIRPLLFISHSPHLLILPGGRFPHLWDTYTSLLLPVRPFHILLPLTWRPLHPLSPLYTPSGPYLSPVAHFIVPGDPLWGTCCCLSLNLLPPRWCKKFPSLFIVYLEVKVYG